MKYFTSFSFLTVTSALFFSLTLFAQDVEKRIKDIDGEVNKITITTEDGEYTFEGEDAVKLFKKMKSSGNSFVWHSTDKDGKKKIVFLDSDDKEHHVEVFGDDADEMIVISEDIDSDIDGVNKKIKVEVEDGNKTVTVTTKEDGEEKTEVYEGKDADEYIKEMNEKHGRDMDIFIENDSDGKVKKKKVIIEKEVDRE